MSRDHGFLEDMLREARLALSFIAETSQVEFERDVKTQHAVVRCLEIIGEAANNVTSDTRSALPDLPWTEIIRQRHIAVHHYRKLEMPRIWATVKQDLPPRVATLEAYLQ